jgi:polyisoprenoid-binding protein YceI
MDAHRDRECWSIDTEESSLIFSVRHALLGEIRGEFCCWGGRVLLDSCAPSQPSVHVWVDLSSLDTGSRRRNDAILETELFDIQWQPGLVFDGDRIEQTLDGRTTLTGWLDLHCLRQQISIDVTRVPSDEKAAELIATARASIDRRAFGLRREATARDWLSERLVDRTIEMTALIVARPNVLTEVQATATPGTAGKGARARRGDAPRTRLDAPRAMHA